jgi:alcohol dehydrogenase class IV
MALASLFGGLALANAGLGAVHGFAGPMGGMFPAPHGAICAALLPHVMEANIRALEQRAKDSLALVRYTEVGRLLTGDPGATREQGVDWVKRLVAELKIPNLGTYCISSRNIPQIVEKSMNASSMKANPIQLGRNELEQIVRAAL